MKITACEMELRGGHFTPAKGGQLHRPIHSTSRLGIK